jgi:hypothetical protein
MKHKRSRLEKEIFVTPSSTGRANAGRYGWIVNQLFFFSLSLKIDDFWFFFIHTMLSFQIKYIYHVLSHASKTWDITFEFFLTMSLCKLRLKLTEAIIL